MSDKTAVAGASDNMAMTTEEKIRHYQRSIDRSVEDKERVSSSCDSSFPKVFSRCLVRACDHISTCSGIYF